MKIFIKLVAEVPNQLEAKILAKNVCDFFSSYGKFICEYYRPYWKFSNTFELCITGNLHESFKKSALSDNLGGKWFDYGDFLIWYGKEAEE